MQGGLGINLTAASAVVMCDSDWNPQVGVPCVDGSKLFKD